MAIRVESGTKGRVDWTFVLAAVGLVTMGTIAILSAASPLAWYLSIVRTHFVAMFLGVSLFLFGTSFNYQIFQDQVKVVYAATIFILIAVLLVGTSHKGHKAWIHLGPLTFQPAEAARIALILIMAAFLDSRARRVRDFSTVMLGMAVALPIMVLILKEPDFSTVVTFIPIMAGMFFCAGADAGHLMAAITFGLTAASVPLIYTYVTFHYPNAVPGSLAHFVLQTTRFGGATAALVAGIAVLGAACWRFAAMLRLQMRPIVFVVAPVIVCAGLLSGMFVTRQMKSYQRNRFVAYVAPQADIQGAAYHVHQSQIAIGSGGPWGKGLFNGTQSQLGFLPERHTDFIFAVVGEEMGFIGSITILSLYLLLIWRIVSIGKLARDQYGFLVCAGLATMFTFELVLNVGMCLAVMPVAGIPLPLISYGGSSLVISLWSLGIVANIYSRRYALL
jgi:rod shape determining protein RodA